MGPAEVRVVHARRPGRVRVRVCRLHRTAADGAAARRRPDGVADRVGDDRGAGGHRGRRLPRDARARSATGATWPSARCSRSPSGRRCSQTDRDCLRFAQIFVAIMAVYGVDQLLQYASGGGEIAFYGRTTTGDHADPRVHGGRGRHLDGHAAHTTDAVALVGGRSSSARASSLWRSAAMRGSSSAIVFAAFVLLSGAQPAPVPRRDRRRGRGLSIDRGPDLVVARLVRAAEQPRPDPHARSERLRDHEPGPHQRHPRRLGPGPRAPDVRPRGGRHLHRPAHRSVEGRRRHGAQRRRSRCGSSSASSAWRLLRRST